MAFWIGFLPVFGISLLQRRPYIGVLLALITGACLERIAG